ncbi:MAG TPA: TatD family hydrolase [Verrucomicrobiae bacterium]
MSTQPGTRNDALAAQSNAGRNELPTIALRLYDAHNHLQDERLRLDDVMWKELAAENVQKMVVNGACEGDWDTVLDLARNHPQIIPSFGYHPWYVRERSARWREVLIRYLDAGVAAVGEIGLDRWIKDYDLGLQEEMFFAQMSMAAERNLPVSIHCQQAWGRLLELLEDGPRPKCGFVLHSFGGPQEMIEPLARHGAYFSLPGYFAHGRKDRQREAFRHVPPDRLLIETDAPDQPLPPERVRYPLPPSTEGKPLNHPANLGAVYQFAAELLGEALGTLAPRVEKNFLRLFGQLCERQR